MNVIGCFHFKKFWKNMILASFEWIHLVGNGKMLGSTQKMPKIFSFAEKHEKMCFIQYII